MGGQTRERGDGGKRKKKDGENPLRDMERAEEAG